MVEDARGEILRFRVTVAEKAQIVAKANDAGMSLSDFLRAVAMHRQLPSCHSEQWQLPMGRASSDIWQNDHKSESIHFKVSSKEKTWIADRARLADMALSEYMRVIATRKEICIIDVKVLKRLLYELQKVGGNLNQLLILCHQGKVKYPQINDVTAMQQKLLDAFVDLIKQMRKN